MSALRARSATHKRVIDEEISTADITPPDLGAVVQHPDGYCWLPSRASQ